MNANEELNAAVARAAGLVDRGELAAAREIGDDLLAANPHSAAALHLLAVVARRLGQASLAVTLLQRALAIEPDHPGMRCEFGLALVDVGRSSDAVAQFRRSTDLQPDYADACLNLGATLDRLDQPEGALPWSRRAAQLQPDNAIAHFNLANTWRALGRLDEAVSAFETAIRLKPDFASAHWNLACCLLLAGDFARGWPEYQWRDAAGEVLLDDYSQPRWQGESLAGKTILVHGEQGIGDEILFASCLPDLMERAKHCAIICDPRLEALFARSFPGATVHGAARRRDRRGAALAERIDVQAPIGDLPLYFRRAAESFPPRRGFLRADAEQVAQWRSRFAALGPGLKIGVSWRAGGSPADRRKRTTSLAPWRDILATPGAQFVNLQYGDAVDELAAAKQDLHVTIHDWPQADPLVDLDGFAAKIAALDLVISVGNATVHLAGALGVSAWALLPKVPGWRWMMSGARSVWYPHVRLLRQSQRGVWQPVFAEAARLLAVAARSSDPAAAIATNDLAPATRPRSPFIGRENGTGVSLNDLPASRRVYPGAREAPIRVGNSGSAGVNPAARPTAPAAESQWAATYQAALAALERGETAAAETHCRAVLDHAPRHLQALNLLGVLARQTNRVDLAIRTLERAVAIGDRDPGVWLNMAGALQDAGKMEQAIDAYRRAAQLQPASIDAHLGLGKALWAVGRRAEAADALAEVVRLRPDHHKALNQLGGLHLELNRPADAERAFREAVRIKPDYMAAHNNLGLALERQERFREAAACYDQALAIDPNCAQAVGNLGKVLDRLGEHSVAALLRKQAATLQPVR